MPTPKPAPMPELLPCPFCNSKPWIDHGDTVLRIRCADPKCQGGNNDRWRLKAEAIAAWNQRAPSPVNAALVEDHSLANILARMNAHELRESLTLRVQEQDKLRHEKSALLALLKELLDAQAVYDDAADVIDEMDGSEKTYMDECDVCIRASTKLTEVKDKSRAAIRAAEATK